MPPHKQLKRGGGGSKQQQHKVSVSPAVSALQTLISRIENPPPKSESQGCFCQARVHPLSPYPSTTQCTSCGLVLCSLNPPYHPCPSATCRAPLLADHASRRALLDQLSAQVAQTIADEENARRRDEEARARAADAFPELGGGSTTPTTAASSRQPRGGVVAAAAAAMAGNYTTQMQEPQHQQFHKVLSLSTKGKVTATYTRVSPFPLHAKANEDVNHKLKEVPPRVPPPPEGPDYVKLDPSPADLLAAVKKGLYENLRGDGPVYTPLPRDDEAKVMRDAGAGESSGRRRRPQNRRKKKPANLANLPAAAATRVEAAPPK